MKILSLLFFIGISVPISAQHVFHSKFKNVNSKKHVHIAGTRFSIIPPEGFHTKPGFIGVEKNDSMVIQFLDKPESNFITGVSGMIKDFSSSTGVITDSGDTKVGDYKAKFVVMETKPPGNLRSYFILFGDTSFTAIVYTACQRTDSIINREIVHSLQSIYFDKALKFDPFEVAIFTVDETKSMYKFSEYTSGTFIYTLDGKKILSSDENSSAVSIGMPPRADTLATAADISTGFSNMIVGDASLHIYKVKPISTQPINGFNADEMVMHGIMDRKQVFIYQMVMVSGKRAIFVQAFIKSDHENQLIEIRKLAATLKFK